MKEVGLDPKTIPWIEKMRNWPRIEYRHVKRVLDILLALNFLLIFGLIMLILVIAIKLHSPGPVFYRQKRIGKNCKPFDMLKFRSMCLGSDRDVKLDIHKDHVQRLIRENTRPRDLGGETLKLANDPRVTRLGKILRKYSLDELPQFINVLKGEMSIVGPRPPLQYEYDMYSDHDKLRLSVLPGMTGLWQVTGRNQVSFQEMVAIDIEYINTMSFWLDLKIILKTPVEMLFSKGAG